MTEESVTKFEYKTYSGRKTAMLILGIAVCLINFVLNIIIGSSSASIPEILTAIVNPAGVSKLTATIAWTIRIPTSLMSILVGASLGLAGATMQTILNNPLASPYTLGISAGAGVGASIAMLTGLGGLAVIGGIAVPLSAFAFALLACLGIYFISRTKGFTSEIMVLTGIGMVFFFQAIQSFLQYIASSEALQAIVFWTFGSLTKADWTNIPILTVVFVVVFIAIYSQSWKLTALKLGDERAKVLGIDVERLRMMMFILMSLLTATAVAFVGSIGFIGIVGPHIARIVIGEDQRFYLPMSAVCGAAILSLASVATKIIVPGAVFPIGILTAIIGVPFFFALILRKRG
ncbi:MAG: iron ABC transporter permease [Lachnospiraceae bacterium]|nr:iron ABC transporter permease [Lachnospiraceae bacterium]